MATDEERRDFHLRHLYEALHAASRDYDQAILALSGGTLALSVTFADSIAPEPGAGTQTWLIAAWVLLALAMASIVISFLTSQGVIKHEIGQLLAREEVTPSRLRWVTLGTNIIAGFGLVVGLGCLGWYAVQNINGGTISG